MDLGIDWTGIETLSDLQIRLRATYWVMQK
jgi:hypothetical protein